MSNEAKEMLFRVLFWLLLVVPAASAGASGSVYFVTGAVTLALRSFMGVSYDSSTR